MDSTPSLRVARIAQLDPGELFLFKHAEANHIGFRCHYDDNSSPKPWILPLNPELVAMANGPRLFTLNATAVSFGLAFTIQLPTEREAWSETVPTDDYPCLVLVGSSLFFRGNGRGPL